MTTAQVLALAQGALTERQFEAFRSVHVDGFSQRSAARMMGIDRSGFRHHLNRAYERLSVLPEVREWACEHGLGQSQDPQQVQENRA